jgi:hypothetical protein
MSATRTSWWAEFADPTEVELLGQLARQRRWGLCLAFAGWLHLVAFSACYYLTIVCDSHQLAAYLSIWAGELLGVAVIFRLCGRKRPAAATLPMERLVVRV